MKNTKSFRVGFVQNNPVFANVQENLNRVEELIKNKSADMFVLPELFATGYQFKDMEESRSIAEPVPGGITTNMLTSIARKTNTFILLFYSSKLIHLSSPALPRSTRIKFIIRQLLLALMAILGNTESYIFLIEKKFASKRATCRFRFLIFLAQR